MLLPTTADAPWLVGFIIGVVIVLVVVALVVPILVLAKKIGDRAETIDAGLERAVEHTSALAGLNNTNTMAINVIQGLERGRKRLGG